MADLGSDQDAVSGKAGLFATTHWSMVLEAGRGKTPQASQALERLCQAYWFPVYAFVRRKEFDVQEAQDLTQAFFADLLEGGFLRSADPKKGRFRSFLLGALDRFLAKEWAYAHRQKRGAGREIVSLDDTAETRYQSEPAHDLTPEKIYERCWALSLLEQALAQLRTECHAEGKSELFEKVEGMLSGEKEGFSYEAVAAELGMKEGAVRTAVHRLRRRYADILRHQISQTVTSQEEVAEEIRHLFRALRE